MREGPLTGASSRRLRGSCGRIRGIQRRGSRAVVSHDQRPSAFDHGRAGRNILGDSSRVIRRASQRCGALWLLCRHQSFQLLIPVLDHDDPIAIGRVDVRSSGVGNRHKSTVPVHIVVQQRAWSHVDRQAIAGQSRRAAEPERGLRYYIHLAMAGVIVGLGASLAATRALSALLYGVSAIRRRSVSRPRHCS